MWAGRSAVWVWGHQWNLPQPQPEMRSLCDFAALLDHTLSAVFLARDPELCAACVQVVVPSASSAACLSPQASAPEAPRLHCSPRSWVAVRLLPPALWWVASCSPSSSRPVPPLPSQQTPLMSCDWTMLPLMRPCPLSNLSFLRFSPFALGYYTAFSLIVILFS